MQDPLHVLCYKPSTKLFIYQVKEVQDERHAIFGAKAQVELEKSAAKRKALSVGLLSSDSQQIFEL